jgi:hypothetical protein
LFIYNVDEWISAEDNHPSSTELHVLLTTMRRGQGGRMR